MIYESDISGLLSQWRDRLNFTTADPSYKIAVSECMYDLRKLMSNHFLDEMDAFIQNLPSDEVQSYLDEVEADSYLSTLTAHEA